MADLPPLAADDVAKLLTTNIKRPDGKDATAFNQQATALKAMRAESASLRGGVDGLIRQVDNLNISTDARLDALEQKVAALEAQPPSGITFP